jgi:uncharacterized membrane protein YfcA
MAGSFKFFSEDSADFPRAVALGIPAVLLAPLGAVAAGRVSGRTLQLAFNGMSAVILPAQAAYFAWNLTQTDNTVAPSETQTETQPPSADNLAALPPPPSKTEQTQHALFGGLIGFSGGFMGVAGLPFVVMWFNLMSDLTHQQSVGTTFMACTPAVLAGAGAHIFRGNVPLVMLAPLAVGASVGTYLGSMGHLATPTPVLQAAFAFSLALAGGRAGFTVRRLLMSKA